MGRLIDWLVSRLRSERSDEEYYCGLCGRMMPISHFPH